MRFRDSIKFKLTMIMAAVVTSVVVIVCVLNSIFFEKYYFRMKEKELIASYQELSRTMSEVAEQTLELSAQIQKISAMYSMNVFVIDSNWNVTYSTQYNSQDAIRWLQDFMFLPNNNTVLSETQKYVLQRGYDTKAQMSYLVVYGTTDRGDSMIIQVVLESMQDTVRISNRFVIIVGIAVLIISMVLVFFISTGFTKPVKELSLLAEDMSSLKFEAKYTGRDRGELGKLGHSMNTMSERLELAISELKSANLSLQKDIERKNQNEEMRRDFIANVSHELKSPLALVQGYAEGLKEGLAQSEEDRDYYCDVIMDEAGKMNHLVQNLLTLNQLEYGQTMNQIERFDLAELIDAVVKANELYCRQENICLRTELMGTCFIWCDELQMEEVLTNYMSNAIHHCEGERQILVSLKKEAACAHVEIMNTGRHIPEEDLPYIWDKFYKVDKARTRSYGGNGIGLSIVKAILDNYNGRYGAYNQDNGVVFWFELECEDEN